MDKPQLDEPTIYDELAAYVERHAEFYPNARAKPTADVICRVGEAGEALAPTMETKALRCAHIRASLPAAGLRSQRPPEGPGLP